MCSQLSRATTRLTDFFLALPAKEHHFLLSSGLHTSGYGRDMGQSDWAVPPSAGGVAPSRDFRKTAKFDEEAKSNLAIEFQSCSTLQVGAAAPRHPCAFMHIQLGSRAQNIGVFAPTTLRLSLMSRNHGEGLGLAVIFGLGALVALLSPLPSLVSASLASPSLSRRSALRLFFPSAGPT